ncbi:hypothetical protein ACIG56_33070 [Nocardia fusca]|uniref:hypothetical protein n=1 Tax=Nocardia fusca TaxID=941183 RepID=UPI0037C59372
MTLSEIMGNRAARKSNTAVPALIPQFEPQKKINPHTRWAAGNAVYSIPAGKQYFDQLAAIAADRSFGMQRQMIVDWLKKADTPAPRRMRWHTVVHCGHRRQVGRRRGGAGVGRGGGSAVQA